MGTTFPLTKWVGLIGARHEVTVLARSEGVDITTEEGLAAALTGAEVVVDATNAGTTEQGPAAESFVA